MRSLLAISLFFVAFCDTTPQVYSFPVATSSVSHEGSTGTSTVESSKGTSSSGTTPLRLEDITSDGIDVPFETKYVPRGPRKVQGEMKDPSDMTRKYREKLPNESDRLYQRRKTALFSKKEGLEKIKHGSTPEEWQDFLRQRASDRARLNRMMEIRKLMTEQGVLHPSTLRHVRVEEKAPHSYRVTPIKRRPNYVPQKRRTDRYLARIQDHNFKPLYRPRKKVADINESESSEQDYQSSKRTRLVGPTHKAKDHGIFDPILGFKVARKVRSERQPYESMSL
jgi:hypothetical protein